MGRDRYTYCSTALQQFRDERREAADTYSRVAERLASASERERVSEQAIAQALAERAQIKGFTKGQAARLLHELEALQAMHGWSILGPVDPSGGKLRWLFHPNVEVEVGLDLVKAQVRSVHLDVLPQPVMGKVASSYALPSSPPHPYDSTQARLLQKDRLQKLLVTKLNRYWSQRLEVRQEGPQHGVRMPFLLRHVSACFAAARHLEAEIAAVNLHFPLHVRCQYAHDLKLASTGSDIPAGSGLSCPDPAGPDMRAGDASKTPLRKRRSARASFASAQAQGQLQGQGHGDDAKQKDDVLGIELEVPIILPSSGSKWMLKAACPFEHLVQPRAQLFAPENMSWVCVYARGTERRGDDLPSLVDETLRERPGMHALASALVEGVRQVDA